MKPITFAIALLAAVVGTRTEGLAQLQERPQIPREWYSEVVLWNYGENRWERYAAGCLRWSAHTRTWYDICRTVTRRGSMSVRY